MQGKEKRRFWWTKAALLAFGAGLLLGLAAVASEIAALGYLASGLMALGIGAIPLGLLADGRRAIKVPQPIARQPAARPARRKRHRPAPASRRRTKRERRR